MQFEIRRPARPLADFVECLWLCASGGTDHPRERLLPDGSMELVIDLLEGGDPSGAASGRGGVLLGPRAESFCIETSRPISALGVHFRPGGALPFLGFPATEVQGAVVPWEEIWKGRARDLRSELLENPAPAIRFRLLERFLLARITRPLAWPRPVAFGLTRFAGADAPSVASVIDETGLSHRRFTGVFGDHVGLSPKVYSRLQRFQRALRRLERGASDDLAGLALDCGYFDQAHFNHDFRAFSGLTPTAFLARWTGRTNHVPDADPIPVAG
ncbi:MAG TPA: helix-turn-helix domain-containing protein [Candidatus Polarisedimenticolia bacterium]|nr:helix-turn-helix domain-containing protein [Candidatus Polarisedimenticolia bacterium]